jgi:hypothetical protein
LPTLGGEIVPLFKEILLICDRMGLIGCEMFAIDGVKLANARVRAHTGRVPALALAEERSSDPGDPTERQRTSEGKTLTVTTSARRSFGRRSGCNRWHHIRTGKREPEAEATSRRRTHRTRQRRHCANHTHWRHQARTRRHERLEMERREIAQDLSGPTSTFRAATQLHHGASPGTTGSAS